MNFLFMSIRKYIYTGDQLHFHKWKLYFTKINKNQFLKICQRCQCAIYTLKNTIQVFQCLDISFFTLLLTSSVEVQTRLSFTAHV